MEPADGRRLSSDLHDQRELSLYRPNRHDGAVNEHRDRRLAGYVCTASEFIVEPLPECVDELFLVAAVKRSPKTAFDSMKRSFTAQERKAL